MLKNCWALVIVALYSLCCPHIATTAAASHSPYVIDVWANEEGLPQSSVISVIQDKEGYLWMGTLDGLVRFDGVRFKVFDEANTPGLNSRRIVHLFEDSKTNIWVGSESDGVFVIRPDGSVGAVPFEIGNPAGRLVAACEDWSGTIWLNALDHSIARFANNQLEILGGGAKTVVTDRTGAVWIGTENQILSLASMKVHHTTQLDFLIGSRKGFWRFADGEIEKWEDDNRVRSLGAYPWGSAKINAACEDIEGNPVVGTGAGVYWYDNEGRATRISSESGLSHNTVLSLCTDREGNLWVGTDGGGLNRLQRPVVSVTEGSHGFAVQSVCDDRAGGVWFAVFGGKLAHWKNGVLTEIEAKNLPDANIRSVFVDRRQRVWFGATGVWRMENGTFEQFERSEALGPVSVIHQDDEGRMWIGSFNGLFLQEQEGQDWKQLSTGIIRALWVDRDQTAWIGTERGGLQVLRNGEMTSLRKDNSGLPNDTVTALWRDSDGVLWIGTAAGLARYHDGKWTRYTTREGLVSNGIGYLMEDAFGNLWVGSYAGLMRISKTSLNDFADGKSRSVFCRVYGSEDGVPSRECTQGSQPAAAASPDGRLWFSTIKGLVSIHPSELRVNTNQPPVVIESVLVEGRELRTNELSRARIDTVTLSPRQKRIEIHYATLSPGSADRSRFRYWLEGHDAATNEVGAIRAAIYSNLQPGRYRFHVTAYNEDGVESALGSVLSIRVQPPFWRTWWFIAAVSVVILGWIVGTVHYLSTQKLQRQVASLRQQEALERERARIARDLHDQLGANLTQVALLGELADSDKEIPEEVGEHARQISITARETTRSLDEIVWAVNPSNDTLEGLITYLCKYAQEYFELAGLKYRLEVPSDLPPTPIPPDVRHNVFLAAKEAVNNVVKHAQAVSTFLRLKLESDRFTLEIADDGRGPGAMDSVSGRNGLRNMRKRMEDIGGSFEIVPGPDKGTVVRLVVPIKPV